MNSNKKKVLVTGASGFIGKALVHALVKQNFEVLALSRSGTSYEGVENFQITNYSKEIEQYLLGVDTVYHLAARAHLTGEVDSEDSMRAYLEANCDTAVKIFELSDKSKVKNFVFLSSIGVCGNVTIDKAFTENTKPKPIEQYAISKWKAEQKLFEIAKENGRQVSLTVVRPPLVYGAEAPGNFSTLMRLSERKIPLPIGAINNKKSFIYIHNLVDFLINYCTLPAAKNELFLICDDTQLSTPALYKELAKRFDAKLSIIYIPFFLLKLASLLLGKTVKLHKLNTSLLVDCSKAKTILNWQPKITPQIALDKTISQYKEKNK